MGAGDGAGAGGPEPDGDPGVSFEVPDDASSLEADRLAWLAEERRRRARRRARRLIFTRRWERFGLSGPIVVICLLATSVVAALAVLFVPRPRTPPPAPAPLASAFALVVPTAVTPQATGEDGALAGRLLPATTLVDDTAGGGAPIVAQALRPALVLLVPDRCACTAAVHALYLQGREFRLPVWLVGTGGPGTGRVDLADLDQSATGGGSRWAVDGDAALARAVAASGLSALLVAADGRLRSVRRNLPLDAQQMPGLEPDLSRLAADTR